MVPETLISCTSAITSVLLYYTYAPTLALNLSWIAVSLMLVFPLTNALSSAFKRREDAISHLAAFRANITNIYQAHLTWDWPGAGGWGGRGQRLEPKHTANVRALMLAIIDRLQELLLVPRRGRMRHTHTSYGKLELVQVITAETRGRRHVAKLIGRLHLATEALKQAGLPANEASRINGFICNLTVSFEKLWVIKVYRTSIALRGLAYVTILLMPAFYGPYYLYVSRTSEGDNVPFACAFACLISSLLVSLQSLARLMENPFLDRATDCIRVKEEMQLCRQSLAIAHKDLRKCWHLDLDAEDEIGDEFVAEEAIPVDAGDILAQAAAEEKSPEPAEGDVARSSLEDGDGASRSAARQGAI